MNSALAANGQVRVLVHEIAHSLGFGYRDYGRQQAEVQVDTVTHIVCGSVGLDVSGSSVPCVAGWGEDGELGSVRVYAETVDVLAHRIENSLHGVASDPREVRPSDGASGSEPPIAA